MDFSRYITSLVWENFMGMVKRGEIASLGPIKNDSKKLEELLKSIGAKEEILSKPAHREELASYLKSIIDKVINLNKEEQVGEINLGRTPKGIKMHYEGFRSFEDSILEFKDEKDKEGNLKQIYEIRQECANVKSKRIKGNTRTIDELVEEKAFGLFQLAETRYTRKVLDDNGFVIKKSIKMSSETKNERYIRAETYERDGIDITITIEDSDEVQKNVTSDGNDSEVRRKTESAKWNGQPDDINDYMSTSNEFMGNMIKIISQYPDTRKYYEKIVGKQKVDEALKLFKSQGR